MAISRELRDEIVDFFSSTAGNVVLSKLSDMQESNNNLRAVMNAVRTETNPELELARKAGIVDGLELAMNQIEMLMEGEE